jgi:arginine/lysine/ornithine decarboxylase
MPTSGNTPPALPFTTPPPAIDAQTIEEATREASARPLDFSPSERALYVRTMVQRVTEFKRAGRSTADIRQLLPEFVRDYPHLFETLTQEGEYDEANLRVMLSMLDRMGAGNLNQHQASVIVGQRLYEKYRTKGPERGT